MKQCLQMLYLVSTHLADSRETPHTCERVGLHLPEMSFLRTEMVESDVKAARSRYPIFGFVGHLPPCSVQSFRRSCDSTLHPRVRFFFPPVSSSAKSLFQSVAAGVEKFMKERSDDAILVFPLLCPPPSCHNTQLSKWRGVGGSRGLLRGILRLGPLTSVPGASPRTSVLSFCLSQPSGATLSAQQHPRPDPLRSTPKKPAALIRSDGIFGPCLGFIDLCVTLL